MMKNLPVRKQEKVTYLPGTKRLAPKRRFHFAFCLLIFVFIYFSVLFISQYRNLYQMKRTLYELETQITLVREQNDRMLSEIELLYTHTYLEKAARQDLGMVRPGELLFFFREEDRLQGSGQ
jgi:cell division protein FtsB